MGSPRSIAVASLLLGVGRGRWFVGLGRSPALLLLSSLILLVVDLDSAFYVLDKLCWFLEFVEFILDLFLKSVVEVSH